MVNVNESKCIGCGDCTEVCSFGALEVADGTVMFKEGSTCNECGHCAAICPTDAISVAGAYDPSDAVLYEQEKFSLSPEIFLNALKFRRSAREFKNTEIPEEKLNAILEAGGDSPNASNRQQLKYIVLGKKAAEETCRLAHSIFKAATDDIEHREEYIQKYFKGIPRYYDVWIPKCKNYFEKGIDQLFYNAPCVIIMAAKKDDPWAVKDSSIAYGNMDMMANVLGLGTCFIGMFELAGSVDRKLYDYIGIKEDETPLVTFVLGEPRVKYLRTAVRKKLDLTIK